MPPHAHAALIERFYAAFQARDAATMAACYHPEVVFRDPAFGELRGAEVGAMWEMLCGRAKDLDITYSAVTADEVRGSARWDARYTFTQTGRPVHNVITAGFEFRDGKIVSHVDDFSFWRWSRQALGPVGWLLGWTPWLAAKVRRTARQGLQAFRAKQTAGRVG